MHLIHATCIALESCGILLRGPSGSGKSDLALRMIDGGAVLVADDQVDLAVDADGRLRARPPERIAGLLEVRGLGILTLDFLTDCALDLVVDLVDAATIERLPEAAFSTVAGCRLRHIRLAPFEASAPAKLRLALHRARAENAPARRLGGQA